MTSILNSSNNYVSSTASRWTYLATAYFIIHLTGALGVIDRIRYGEWEGKTSDQLIQSLNLLQILVSIFLFWVGYNKSRGLSRGETLLLAVVAFLFLSVLWSVDPQTTLRRSSIYFFFVLGVIGIAKILSGDEYLQLVRRLVFLSAIASLVLLVVPSANVLMSDGSMRGVFQHKNVLGQVMAAGVLASLHGMRDGGGHRRSCAAMIVVFAGLAFLSRSSTSLIVILAFCGAEVFVALYRRNVAAGIMMIIVFIPALVVFVISPDIILGLLGKDETLTGRTDLWEYVKICISQRPLLGWGFDAFWSQTNPAASEISRNLGWVVPEAHNGLLELRLETGGVGTSLFALVFVRNIWIAARCLRTPAKELGRTLLLCCGSILLVGVSEEVLVDPSQISLGMLFVMGLTGERMLRAVAQQRRFRAVTAPLRTVSARGSD